MSQIQQRNKKAKSEVIMGLLSNKIDRQELKHGDHIYCWRQAFIYAHHGIYVGEGKVIHFTQGPAGQENGSFIISSSLPKKKISDVPCPQCGDQNSSLSNGVILSCIDCFLSDDELYLFEYGVSWAYFLAKVRGGTCTLATSDPPGAALHRANFLLENGFGDYDVFKNNCEDFAIYCKTGLLVIVPSTRGGQSGQVATLEATSSGLISYSLHFLINKFKGVAAVGGGVYYFYSRLNSDIGVRRDVARVAVERLVPPAPVPVPPTPALVPPSPVPIPSAPASAAPSPVPVLPHVLPDLASAPAPVPVPTVPPILAPAPVPSALAPAPAPVSDSAEKQESEDNINMGLLSNKIDRQELQPGDHIYCWRQAFIYAHHGIYIGDGKVIHFTQGPAGQEIGNVIISSSLPAPQYSEVPCPQCGDHYSSFNNGVILSCINCFLSGGELYLFEYGVSRAYFIANVRGGTCTVATSDPPGDVLHRAYFLLENGFGNYDLFKNNCENFAIYCKTCLLIIIPSTRVGQSGQVAALESTSGLIFSSLALLTYKFRGFAAVGSVYYGCSGVYYCYNRLNSDIGVRSDVARVAVESLVPPAPVPPAPVERLVPTTPPAPVERLDPPAPPAPVERLVTPAPPAPVKRLVPPAPPAPFERLVPTAPPSPALVGRLVPPAPAPTPVSNSSEKQESEDIMGLLSNKIDRQELKHGDHIYCWRQAFIYAHHGIYVGEGKVIHFIQGPAGQKNGRFIISSSLPTPQFSDVPCPQCGDQNSSFSNGVILSCIDCFLSGGELNLFEYGVSWAYFLAKVRGGTCTRATSDPPEAVLHRANELLENGFGGQSGQAATLEAASSWIFSSLALFIKFNGVAVVGNGVCYCYNRLNSDIGVRRDVAKVTVERLVPSAPVPPTPALVPSVPVPVPPVSAAPSPVPVLPVLPAPALAPVPPAPLS
ncbi:hypothetical protein LWI29_004074 [Acer saccharum]|uniref:LRAT domain-containing protein n=1 Tax=Acer saccharum TaxID=4024 RepID=A0AA39SJF2_ACESA|nr:hypothetical protein LWI29_004074 [Acer saccharum]